jgi:hypothetical protein
LPLPFARLLQLATRHHILVARLGLGQPRRFLTWEASLLPAQHDRSLQQTLTKNLLPVNREFVIEYETEIPRSVKAYHPSLEVRQEISVRRFHRGSTVPRSARVPLWLRDARRSTRRTVEPDDFFDARGEM